MTDTTVPSQPRPPPLANAPRIALRTPLVCGEDADAYAQLLADVMASVRPTGILEEMWLRDVVNNYWETERLRQLLYRPAPTRLTPPFALPPALCRTAARAPGRGLSTTPALATQPPG